MVGHGTVRGRVLGKNVRRAATADEIETMKALVKEGMDDGRLTGALPGEVLDRRKR